MRTVARSQLVQFAVSSCCAADGLGVQEERCTLQSINGGHLDYIIVSLVCVLAHAGLLCNAT